MLLPDDGDDDDASCYKLHLHHSGPTVTALVSVLCSGVWTVRCSAEAALPTPPDRIPMLTTLAAGKIYMVAVAGYILGLDMATASFFVVDLPEGVAYEYYGNLQPARLAGGGWLVLICCEKKVLLVGCWWLICSERKVLLAGG
jgi:energy-converting hydrogenase Eha subunit C